MTRDFDGDEEGLPWELWQNIMSRVLLSKYGQEALAELEAALLEMPEKKIIEGRLAGDGSVCAVGAYIARKRAKLEGVSLATMIERMQDSDVGESSWETVSEGESVGLNGKLAWHLAFLNDEEWAGVSPEIRYDMLLNFTQRALGRPDAQPLVRV